MSNSTLESFRSAAQRSASTPKTDETPPPPCARAPQRDNGIDSVDGHLELASRDKYATLHNLPLPGSGRVTPDAGADQKNTCVDVCAEFTGIRDCQTRCARDKRDKKHACREACQTAFGSACDRAFPASGEGGSTNFKICLSYMSASCEDTCGKFRS